MMMLSLLSPELQKLGPSRLAGILSRAALALENDDNPSAAPLEADELKIRSSLLQAARSYFEKQAPSVPSDELAQRVAELLDEEASKLEGPVDEQAALARLSADAVLPSDAYEIRFEGSLHQIIPMLGVDDSSNAITTIKAPDFTQDFGANEPQGQPIMISLFGRWFDRDSDRDRFLLIVACSRHDSFMQVNQFWRIYPSEFPMGTVYRLTDLLSRFAETFGIVFQVNDWRGRYLYEMKVLAMAVNIQWPTGAYAGVVTFRQENEYVHLAFGVCVDVEKYSRYVKKHLRRHNRAPFDVSAN